MYPDTPNFEPSRMECPRCGATNSNRSEDRVVQGNTRFELDSDGFRVVFEVACPCGFRHEITIDWEAFDDDHTWPEDEELDPDDLPDAEGSDSIVDDAVDAGPDE